MVVGWCCPPPSAYGAVAEYGRGAYLVYLHHCTVVYLMRYAPGRCFLLGGQPATCRELAKTCRVDSHVQMLRMTGSWPASLLGSSNLSGGYTCAGSSWSLIDSQNRRLELPLTLFRDVVRCPELPLAAMAFETASASDLAQVCCSNEEHLPLPTRGRPDTTHLCYDWLWVAQLRSRAEFRTPVITSHPYTYDTNPLVILQHKYSFIVRAHRVIF